MVQELRKFKTYNCMYNAIINLRCSIDINKFGINVKKQ